ncbi:hypothetical protein [Archangium gephyra]|uniref:hypothetical protein n=1 Tax=Archangium gephyra TaxID=48 RepID=UPI003B97E8E5
MDSSSLTASSPAAPSAVDSSVRRRLLSIFGGSVGNVSLFGGTAVRRGSSGT